MRNINLGKKSNIFTSKADVLKLLNSKVKLSKIEKIFTFSVNDWVKDQEIILKRIQSIFKKNLVV